MKCLLVIALCLCTLPAFAAGGTCPSGANYVNPANPTGSLVTLGTLGITSCYYFSQSSGSDSNNGTSESTPQQYVPCMYDVYTGSLQSVLNAGAQGLGFIMKGGDTWGNAAMECGWWGGGPSGGFNNWSGTSSHPVYIGVDLTWPSSGWTRPIWSCGGAVCNETANGDGFYKDTSSTQYIILDDIEFTGLYQTASNTPGYTKVYGSNNTFTRLYAHGWSRSAASDPDQSTAFSASNCCGGGANNNFYFDIADGSDTNLAAGTQLSAVTGSVNIFAYGVLNYVTNGVEGQATQVHDTLIENMNWCFTTGGGGPGGIGNCHQNAIQQSAPVGGTGTTASAAFFYNNVITGLQVGGITKLWLNQDGSVPSGTFPTYAFNNVVYGNTPGNDINPAQEGTQAGTSWYFNNSFQCGNDTTVGPCMGGSGLAPTQIVHFINNHCISTGSTCIQVTGSSGFTGTETTDLVQCTGTGSTCANQNASPAFNQYNDSQTYAISPVASTNSTVGAGTDEQSLCTTINSLDTTAGAACKNDTGYAMVYNTSNHTVSFPGRTENARPLSGAWDIGAYLYTSGSTYTITISSITGNGTVTSSDSVINCTTGTTGTCTDSSATGTITLTETPSAGYSFANWGGGTCSGSSSTCAVTGAATVTATFTANSTVGAGITNGTTLTTGTELVQ